MAAERARVQVQITTGKDKGKTGEVIEVKRAQNRVVVAGLNLGCGGGASRSGMGQRARA